MEHLPFIPQSRKGEPTKETIKEWMKPAPIATEFLKRKLTLEQELINQWYQYTKHHNPLREDEIRSLIKLPTDEPNAVRKI